MGLFSSLLGLFTTTKVFNSLSDEGQSLGADMFDMAVSSAVGKVVKDVAEDMEDEISDNFNNDNELEYYDWTEY